MCRGRIRYLNKTDIIYENWKKYLLYVDKHFQKILFFSCNYSIYNVFVNINTKWNTLKLYSLRKNFPDCRQSLNEVKITKF